jgi:hypothetical protein
MRDFHGLSILCMNYPDEVDHDLTDVTGMMCFTSGIPEVAVSDFQVSESILSKYTGIILSKLCQITIYYPL